MIKRGSVNVHGLDLSSIFDENSWSENQLIVIRSAQGHVYLTICMLDLMLGNGLCRVIGIGKNRTGVLHCQILIEFLLSLLPIALFSF